MPLRRAKPLTWHFVGCSDAINGTNAFPGAMANLINLCPSPTEAKAWVPRPARDFLTNFVATTLFANPSTIQGISVFADTCFGLITTTRNPGRDEPFAVDLITGQIITVSGITRDNTPTTPPELGATQLPIGAVVGAYDVWTHPGFPGGRFNPDGLVTTVTANTIAGQSQMTGYFLSGFATGQIFPGMTVTDGAGAIPPGTFVINTDTVDFNVLGTGISGNNFFTVNSIANIAVGQMLAGPGPFSGFVSSIAGATVTYTGSPIPANFTNQTIGFHGTLLRLSQSATATVNNDSITLATAGDRSIKFGWFDLTGLNTQLSTTATGGSANYPVSNIAGLSPGQNVSGATVPTGARIKTIHNPTYSSVFGGGNGGAPDVILNIDYAAGTPTPLPLPPVGASISGPGLAAGTTVVSASWQSIGPTSSVMDVTASNNLSGSGPITGLYNVGGLYVIVLDMNATGSGSDTLRITGGTFAAPLWCAGDTMINGLPSTPVGVDVFNGSAFFACEENGSPISDAANPASITYASQAIIPGTREPVTAVKSQPLLSPITGGMTQAIYLYQSTQAIQQVTGSLANGFQVQALNIATGTLAPGSIANTTLGQAFMSPDGMRMIDFSGTIGQPIGEGGQGIVSPFINTGDPTRVVAAANGATLRIAVPYPSGVVATSKNVLEWWYDLKRKVWGGPHTLQTSRLAPYGQTFIAAAVDVPAQLYRSASVPSGLTDLNEDGSELTWQAQTLLLPDTEAMFENAVNEATLGIANPSDQGVVWRVLDETTTVLDSGIIPGAYTEPLYGSLPVWGAGAWYATQGFQSAYRQEVLKLHRELTFKQASFSFNGTSRFGLIIDALRLRYQVTGYLMQEFPSTSLDISVPPLPNAPIINGTPQALVVAATAAQFTPIGALLAQQAHYSVAELPTWDLRQQQAGISLALTSFSDISGTTGTTHSSTTIDSLSTNVLANGWLPGHSIEDAGGAIRPGTFITAIALDGLSLTLSQPAVRSLPADVLVVEGTTLATNWSTPILPGTFAAEVRATLRGFLTSFYAFLLTVTP